MLFCSRFLTRDFPPLTAVEGASLFRCFPVLRPLTVFCVFILVWLHTHARTQTPRHTPTHKSTNAIGEFRAAAQTVFDFGEGSMPSDRQSCCP